MNNELTHRRATLTVSVITSLLTTFSASALTIAVPAIGAEFGSNAAMLGWVVNAYMLCSVSLAVPFGKIADATSRRRVLLAGIATLSLLAVLTVGAWSLAVLIALRVAQGIGAAMIFATNNAILVDAFPPEERGKVFGLSTAACYVGLSLGPVLGGFLTYNAGWRAIFVATFALGLAAFLVALFKMKPKPQSRSHHPTDWLGMCLYIGAVFPLMYGFSVVDEPKMGVPLMVVGVLVAIGFCRRELSADDPVLNVRVLGHNRNFLLSNLAALFNYGATFAVTYLISIYLQVVKGFDARAAGLILIIQPVMQAIVSPISGKLSDKHSPYTLASIGMGLCAVSLIVFAMVGLGSPLGVVLGALVVCGVGFGVFSSPNTNAIMSSVGTADYSIASSILATSRNMGQVSSMAVLTVVFSVRLGEMTFAAAPATLVMSTMRVQFLIFSAICVVGIFFSLGRSNQKEGCAR
jgi:EmrB/QacA subfamily drug resistance transporter